MNRLATTDGSIEVELQFNPTDGGTVRLLANEVIVGKKYTFQTFVDGKLYEWTGIAAHADGDDAVFRLPPHS